ncbi:RING finger protein nhl-1-like isoform X1 [Argonauta hians]
MTELVYAADRVEQLLRCAICLDRFNQPKILPCQHTFCGTPCMESLIDHYTRRIKCPECRMEHRVPLDGISAIPNNITVIGFLELPQYSSTVNPDSSSPQPPNSSNPTSDTNTTAAVPEQPSKEHVPASQTKKGSSSSTSGNNSGSLSLPTQPRVPSNHAMCSDCGRMTVLANCSHCNERTCETCRHSHISTLKQEVSRQLQRIRRLLPNVSESLTSVDHRREQLQRMCTAVNHTVAETFEKYIRDLKTRQEYLSSEINTFRMTELNALRTYQENLDLELSTIASFCDCAEPFATQREDIETTSINLQDIKNQAQEHMATLQSHSTLELPSVRQLTLQADDRQLSPAINHFGELMVLLQSSPSSYLRNTLIGPSETVRGTSVREYNESRRQSNGSTGVAGGGASNGSSNGAVGGKVPGSLFEESTKPQASQASSNSQHSSDSALGASGAAASNIPVEQSVARRLSGSAASRDPASLSNGGGALQKDSKHSNKPQKSHGEASSSASLSPRVSQGARDRGAASMDYPPPAQVRSRSLFASSDDYDDDDDDGSEYYYEDINGSGVGVGGRYLTEMEPYDEPYYRRHRGSGASNNLMLYEDCASCPVQRRSLPNSPVLPHRNMEMNPVDLIVPAALTWHPRSEMSSRYGGLGYSQNTLPIAFNWRDMYGGSEQVPRGRRSPYSKPKESNHTTQPRHTDTDEGLSAIEEGAVGNRGWRELSPRDFQSSEYDDDDADGNNGTNVPGPGHRHCKSASKLVTQARNNYRAKSRSWTRFGEHGNEESQFISPRGVAASDDDEIYVCDSSNHRVEVFDNTGIYLNSFGSYGQGNGQFDCVADVAVNQLGNIAVTDRYNNRIQLFDRHGTFQTVIGSPGHCDGELNYPWGLAWDNMGFLYTCDKDNNRIQVFQANGTFVRTFGGPGRGLPSKFDSPYYLAVSPDSHLYVSDCNNHRIQVFTFYGDFLFSFGHEGSDNGQLKYPKGISIDEQGFVLVADSGNNRIQVFRGDGTFYACFGSRGEHAHNFNGPEGVAVMNNSCIVVTDRDNHRVQLF